MRASLEFPLILLFIVVRRSRAFSRLIPEGARCAQLAHEALTCALQIGAEVRMRSRLATESSVGMATASADIGVATRANAIWPKSGASNGEEKVEREREREAVAELLAFLITFACSGLFSWHHPFLLRAFAKHFSPRLCPLSTLARSDLVYQFILVYLHAFVILSCKF